MKDATDLKSGDYKTKNDKKARNGKRAEQGKIESLTLPGEFNEAVHESAKDIDAFLMQEERPAAMWDAKMAAHRHAGLSHVLKFPGTWGLDVNLFRWPDFLYIPKNAKAIDYWIGPAPDDHRYGLDWTSPAAATANKASRLDGTMFSFSQLLNEKAGSSQSSEAGVGIFYKPSMSLGVIDLQPHVNCTATLRTFLEYYPLESAGNVEVKAQLLLAAWQQIPGGFDLLGFKVFDVATTGRRDQSYGAEYQTFQRSFAGADLSAPFVVQAGRTYLLGVVNRISVISTLTTNDGKALPTISNEELRVWGSMSCVVPEIDVLTKQVYIP